MSGSCYGDPYVEEMRELDEVESINLEVLELRSQERTAMPWIISHIDDLANDRHFFRKIFTHCLNAENSDDTKGKEVISIAAFQRVFERLFYVMRDPSGFVSKDYDDADGIISWSEFSRVLKARPIVIKHSISERIFLTFENPDSSRLAQLVSTIVLLTIVTSSLTFICQTYYTFQSLPSDHEKPEAHPYLDYIELGCLALFTAEYVIRFITSFGASPDAFDMEKLFQHAVGNEMICLPSPWMRAFNFVTKFSNLVDLIAILPGLLGLISDSLAGAQAFVVLRVFRLTRIFKVVPSIRTPAMIIARTIGKSTQALYVLAFQLLLGMVVAGSLMWLFEGGEWDSQELVWKREVSRTWNSDGEIEINKDVSPFFSIPHAFWWALVTITTVGYGDSFPTTSYGYLVAVGTMMFGLVVMALPVGVVGDNFSNEWASYHESKEKERTRRELDQKAITFSVQRDDPSELSNMLLIEVWNHRFPDRKSGWKDLQRSRTEEKIGDPVEFMGLALLELPKGEQLREKFEKEDVYKLTGNPAIIDRSVTGSVRIAYRWEPQSQMSADTSGHGIGKFTPFKGKLTVTVVSGENLCNLNLQTLDSRSNPYCTLFLYPRSPSKAREIVCPTIWRTETKPQTLKPEWNESQVFEYIWTSPEAPSKLEATDDLRNQAHNSGGMPGKLAVEDRLGQTLEDKLDQLLHFVGGMKNRAQDLNQHVYQLQSRVHQMLDGGHVKGKDA